MSEPIKPGPCPTCGGTGQQQCSLTASIRAGVHAFDCPTCGGTGRVIGVPEGIQITRRVGDDVQVARFPAMDKDEVQEKIHDHYWEDVPAAVVNLVLGNATQEEAPDG